MKKTAQRNDSLSEKDIENLYQVKPNGDQDILDIAHPEPVFMFQAHDKIHGLVENLKEQQDVTVGKLRLIPNGLQEQTIYAVAADAHRRAQADLFNEVIKLGFMMDRENQDELAILADSCAITLKKQAWTWDEALVGLGLPATVIGGFLLGLGPVGWSVAAAGLVTFALINNFAGKIDQGVLKNCAKAITELNDVINEGDEKPALQSQIPVMIKNISFVKTLGETATNVNISQSDIDQTKIEETDKLLSKYEKSVNLLAGYIPGYIALLKASVENEGGEGSSNFISVIKWVVQKVYPSEIQDAITALTTLQESLGKSHQAISGLKTSIHSVLEKNKDDIEVAMEKTPDQPKPEDQAHPKSPEKSTSPDLEKLLRS